MTETVPALIASNAHSPEEESVLRDGVSGGALVDQVHDPDFGRLRSHSEEVCRETGCLEWCVVLSQFPEWRHFPFPPSVRKFDAILADSTSLLRWLPTRSPI